MENAAMLATDDVLVLMVIIMLVGMTFAKVSKIIKVPDVVLYLLAGIVIGPSVLGLVSIDNFPVGNQLILTFGSAFILYEGGREIHLKVLNKVKITVTLLSTIGVFISAFVVAFFVTKIFGIDPIYALLLGAVIASTDPATLVPVFKQVCIKENVKQTVISESAFNDAAGAIVTVAVLAIIQSGTFSLAQNVQSLVVMIVGGIVVGAVVGISFSFLISDTKFGIFDEFAPIISVVNVAVAYLLAERIHGSGYMATFVAGLICGNKDTFKIQVNSVCGLAQVHVRETLALVMRISIFVLLGTHVNFAVLGKYWFNSLLIVLVLMFIARPISVFLCALLDRKVKWTFKEMLFLCWVRETGVIPAALSGMIVSMKMPNSDIISSVVFMTILITLLIQASTTEIVAKKLDLLEK